MKKLIIILLAVLLIVAMASPVFANNEFVVSGEWVFNEKPDCSAYYLTFDASFTYDGKAIKRIDAYDGYLSLNTVGNEQIDLYYVNNGWYKQNKTIDFGDAPVSVTADFYSWLTANATSVSIPDVGTETEPDTMEENCSCGFPIVDKDFNGLCDVCGLQPIVTGPIDTIYGLHFPALSTVWTDKEQYTVAAIFKIIPDSTYLLVLGGVFDIDYCHTAEYGEAYCKFGSAYAVYVLDGQWTKLAEETGSYAIPKEQTSLFWASKTIYTDSTRVHDFFFVPPTMAGSVTETMLTAVLTEIVAILPITLTFLVGYLALRKALRVLERVLYQA